MAEMEIIIEATDDERKMLEVWRAKWKNQISRFSPNRGCGCCVDIYDVEANDEAIADFNRQFEEISP